MLNFGIWLIVGCIIGWVAGIVIATNAREGRLLKVAVGIYPYGAGVGRHPNHNQRSAQ